MNATFAPIPPVRGRVAFSSQSGGLGIELHEPGRRSSASASRRSCRSATRPTSAATTCCSTGRTTRDTDVILLYLESFGNPRKFARLAARVVADEADRRGEERPHGGRAAAPRRRTPPRSRAPDVAVDALFRQAGVIRVDTLEELLRHRDGARAPAAARRAAGRDRRQRRRARASSRPTRARARARGARALAGDAGRAAQLRVAPTPSVAQPGRPRRGRDRRAVRARAAHRCSPTRRSTRVLAIFVPPLVTRRRGRRGRRSSRAADGRGGEAGRRVLPRPGRRARRAPRRRRRRADDPVVRVPGGGGRARSAAPPTSPTGGAAPEGVGARARRRRRRPARGRWSRPRWRARPTGAWLDPELAPRPCWRASASRVVATVAVSRRRRRRRRGRDARLPGRAQGAAPGASCTRPTSAASRSVSRDEARCATRSPTMADRARRRRWAARSCSRWSRAGVETIVGVTHDPSFGPLVLFGLGGVDRRAARRPRAAARPAHRRRRARARAIAARSRRCCSATAARRWPTSTRSRTCSCVSAGSPTSCPRSPRWTATRSSCPRAARRGRRQDPSGAAGAGPAARRAPHAAGLKRRMRRRLTGA